MNIEGIPDSIPRDRDRDSEQVLARDAEIVEECHHSLDAVKVELFARDVNGERFVGDRAKALIATHVVTIPITDRANGGIVRHGETMVVGEGGCEYPFPPRGAGAGMDAAPCPTCSGPIRETVGMVCQTCGTDYGSRA